MDRLLITGGSRLQGSVGIGGSKNAALPLMAAALLADGPSVLRGVPSLLDIDTMCELLGSLGADVRRSEHTVRIDPRGFNRHEAPYEMVRRMRASVYVMGPMLARLGRARVALPGGCAIGPRPIDLHLRGFEALGAMHGLDHGDVVSRCSQLRGAEFDLSGPAGSSVGATCNVLMGCVRARGTTVIHGAAREPEVADLCAMLRCMGAEIEGVGTATLRVQGVQRLGGVEYTVMRDRIEAGTFMAAVAITGGDAVLKGAPVECMESVVSTLRSIGVCIDPVDGGVRVSAGPAECMPAEIVTRPYPGFPTDMQAPLMALLSVVRGTSVIRETIYTDRFIHAAELTRLGASIKASSGVATIAGVPSLMGAPVMASDLRAGAALIVAGLAADGITEINRVSHIDRGYEAVETKLRGLGATVTRVLDTEPEEVFAASAG